MSNIDCRTFVKGALIAGGGGLLSQPISSRPARAAAVADNADNTDRAFRFVYFGDTHMWGHRRRTCRRGYWATKFTPWRHPPDTRPPVFAAYFATYFAKGYEGQEGYEGQGGYDRQADPTQSLFQGPPVENKFLAARNQWSGAK